MKLVKAGKGVDEAVAAVGDLGSKRHGPLNLGAAAGKVEMCRLLIKDFQANVDATDVEGNNLLDPAQSVVRSIV